MIWVFNVFFADVVLQYRMSQNVPNLEHFAANGYQLCWKNLFKTQIMSEKETELATTRMLQKPI